MNGHIIEFDILQRPKLGIDRNFLQIIQSVESVDDLSEDCVLEVESGLCGVRDEELGPVGVGLAAVGHGQRASDLVLESVFDLILELASGINALPAFATPARIAGLDHESLDTSRRNKQKV